MSKIAWRIERIVAGVSIYEFFVWIGRPLERRDKPHQIRCPFPFGHARGDMNPSARVFPETNKIYCFTEAKGWDVIDAVGQYFGLSMRESIRFIEHKMRWQRTAEEKIARQVKSAKRGEKVRRRRVGTSSEDAVMEAVEKLRKLLPKKIFEELGDVIVYVWDVYEKGDLGKGTMEVQVEWSEWAKALLKQRVRMLVEVARYRVTTVSSTIQPE